MLYHAATTEGNQSITQLRKLWEPTYNTDLGYLTVVVRELGTNTPAALKGIKSSVQTGPWQTQKSPKGQNKNKSKNQMTCACFCLFGSSDCSTLERNEMSLNWGIE